MSIPPGVLRALHDDNRATDGLAAVEAWLDAAPHEVDNLNNREQDCYTGCTALQMMCSSADYASDLDIVRALILRGADVNRSSRSASA